MLNRLWGAPAKLERRLSRGNKNGGARSVERPLVTMLAGTHVETFWRTLEDPDLAIGSGFVNRLAPFCVERGRSLPITRDPDERAAAEIREHLARLASLDPRQVQLNAPAERLWVEYSTEHDRRIGQLGYPKSAIVKRGCAILRPSISSNVIGPLSGCSLSISRTSARKASAVDSVLLNVLMPNCPARSMHYLA